MKPWVSWIAVVALAMSLPACVGEEQTGASTPAAVTKPTSASASAPAAVANEVPPPAYNPVGKRDPFRSYLVELSAQQAMSTPARKKDPTETYTLDQYRLTGLLTGTSQPKAMVEDPDGRGHLVKIGTHIGKDGGVVSRITSTGLVVTEESRDLTGEKKRVNVTVPLPQPELDLGLDQ